MNAIYVVGILVTSVIVTYLLSSGLHEWRTGNKKRSAVFFGSAPLAGFLGMFFYHLIAMLVAM